MDYFDDVFISFLDKGRIQCTGPSQKGKQTKQLLGAPSWPGAPRQQQFKNKMQRQTV